MRGIAAIQIRHLVDRLAQRNITLHISNEAVDKLATDGYDPAYGARPLKRLIQQYVENPLAKRILAGDFADGDSVNVDVHGEGFGCSKS